MTTMFAARLLSVFAVLAPVVLALQPSQAAAQAQLAPVQRAPTYEPQQKKINARTVGFAAGPIEGAPSQLAVEMARVVDDEANLLVVPIVRLGTTERLYLRGADLATINSGVATCSGRTTGVP